MNRNRNLVWKNQSLVYEEDILKFGGSEELSLDVMEQRNPYQFFC